jgi:DNA modification methylase
LQLDVIERCIKLWTNENDIVLTPFGGIGSEVYQALKMGRRGIGIELKPTYYQQAVKNCINAESMKQASLFEDLFV